MLLLLSASRNSESIIRFLSKDVLELKNNATAAEYDNARKLTQHRKVGRRKLDQKQCVMNQN